MSQASFGSTPAIGGPSSPLARQVALSPQQLSPGAQPRSLQHSPSIDPSTSTGKPSLSPGQPQAQAPLALLRILLIRHGLSEDNQGGVWAGHRDTPLAAAGVSQAKALGLALSNCSLVAIYSSDLKRASRTAEEILAVNRTVPPPTLVQTQSLREQNFGQLEGMAYAEAEQVILSKAQSEDARTFRIPDGETLDEVNARMAVSLRRYVLPRLEALRAGQERGTEPQVAIVAHGIAIAEILRVLMGLHDNSDGAPWPDPRESYHRVRLDNTGWTLVEVAVPIQGQARPGSDRTAKSTFVRIVEQNVTDHLQDLGFPQQPSWTSSAASALLAGASTSAEEGERGNGMPHPLAKQSLRHVTPYDSRYLTKELERAGASASMLSGAGKRDGATLHALSSSNMPGTTGLTTSASASALGTWSDAWQRVCIQLLPLFNSDDDSGVSIEDVNDHVKVHIQRSLERSPARALDSLSRDVYNLSATGMLTLNTRLDNSPNTDVQLLEVLSETWKTFYSRILPWLEASLLPLQTDTTLLSLSKNEDDPTSSLRTERIDIRRSVLAAFRDKILLPRHKRLMDLFSKISSIEAEHAAAQQRRAKGGQQMMDEDVAEGPHGAVRLYERLLQLSNVSCSVLSNDASQVATEKLVRALQAGRDASLTLQPNEGANSIGSHASFKTLRNKRTQARHAWMPRSAAKHGARAASFSRDAESDDMDEGGDVIDAMRRARVRDDAAAAASESVFLSSLRSPTSVQEDDSVDCTQVQADAPTFARVSGETLVSAKSRKSLSSGGPPEHRRARSVHEEDLALDDSEDIDGVPKEVIHHPRSMSDTVTRR